MSAPEPIKRPNGKLYRPRRIVAYEIGDEDEITIGVLVLGTHDYDRAKPLADAVMRRVAGPDFAAMRWEAGWYSDGFEQGRRMWKNDEERGRAGICFREFAEMAPAGPAGDPR